MPRASIARQGLIALAVLAASVGCNPSPPRPAAVRPASTTSAPASPPTPSSSTTSGATAAPETLPGVRRDLTAVTGVGALGVAADIDGDGRVELVLADAQRLRVIHQLTRVVAEHVLAGGPQVLSAADLEGDHRAELLLGTGETREHRGAPGRISVLRVAQGAFVEELVAAPSSERGEVADVAALGGGRASQLFLAWYSSRFMVRSTLAERAGERWALREPATELRMASSYAHGDVDGDGAPDEIVARVYGDAQGVDGDAFVLRPDGARVPIPTTRGVRSVLAMDSDGDGRAEVFLADGWHQSYRDRAQALLTWARLEHGAFRSVLIERLEGQFTIWHLRRADVDGDGHPELVSVGDSYVRVYRREGGSWRGLTISGQASDVVAGDFDGAPGDELVVLGSTRTELVSLRDVRW